MHSAMHKHLGKLLPAGAHIMSRLACGVLDKSLRNTICDGLDVSYFQNLFHKSFPEVIVKHEVLSLCVYWMPLLCDVLFIYFFYSFFPLF